MLIQELERYLKLNNYTKYCVRTSRINNNVIEFYLKNKLTLKSKNKNSYFFIKYLKNNQYGKVFKKQKKIF